MNLETYPPSNILKPFVKTFMVIESGQGMVNNILPNTSLVMAFRLEGVTYIGENIKKRLPDSAISGITTSSRLIKYSKATITLLVVFREGAAALFLNDPLHKLFGKHVSLDSLICSRKVSEIEDRLIEANNSLKRIAIVQQFLISELRETQSDPIILNAIQRIKRANGNVKIKDLVANLPVSRDPFEKRFRRLSGTSPKKFSNIIRLRSVIDNYSPGKNLTKTAHEAGYYDQSHFIKDFKSFTGQTPKKFFESPSFW